MDSNSGALQVAQDSINDFARSEILRLYSIKDVLIGYAKKVAGRFWSDNKNTRAIDFEDLISDVIIECAEEGITEKRKLNRRILVMIEKETWRLRHLKGLDSIGKRPLTNSLHDRQCVTCKEVLPIAYFPYYQSEDQALYKIRGRCLYCIRKYDEKRRAKNQDHLKQYHRDRRKSITENNRANGLSSKGTPIKLINHPGEFKILFEHYKIYKDGFIVRMPTGNCENEAAVPLRKTATKGLQVKICHGRLFCVHDLVAQCWHPEWYEGCRVAHQNEDVEDNRVQNLDIHSHDYKPKQKKASGKGRGAFVYSSSRYEG